MPKSLSDRIRERAKKKTSSRNSRNLGLFLAVRDEVIHALEDGWPVKTIWETLHEEGKVTFSYQAFRLYVKRLAQPKGAKETPPASAPSDSAGVSPKKEAAPGLESFKFN